MSTRECAHGSAIVAAARSGEWPPPLKTHRHECAECAEVARVTECLHDLVGLLGGHSPLPDPTYLWLKAEVERRARAAGTDARRSLLGLALAGLATGIGAAATVIAALPELSAAAGGIGRWLSAAWPASVIDMAALGTVWLGLPLFLAVTYLLVLRPLR